MKEDTESGITNNEMGETVTVRTTADAWSVHPGGGRNARPVLHLGEEERKKKLIKHEGELATPSSEWRRRGLRRRKRAISSPTSAEQVR